MNAPIAQPDPSTRKTSAIDTVTTASSTTPQRIDDFIKRKLSEANSADGSGIIDSSNRAAQFGFVNAANVRYSRFLEAFRSSPQLTEMYREKYPNSLFLPWKALHAVLKSLELSLDLPEFYRGAVPSEQLPWMEIFELDPADATRHWEVHEIMPQVSNDARRRLEMVIKQFHDFDPNMVRSWGMGAHASQTEIVQMGRMAAPAKAYWDELQTSFFVVAPPAAFSTVDDWLKRFSELARRAHEQMTNPPPDPLVIRFCHGGALVVAAWGNEAAALNEITKELKL
jgi:hypothetical protein